MSDRQKRLDAATKALDALFHATPRPTLHEAKTDLLQLQQDINIMLMMIEEAELMGVPPDFRSEP